MTRRSACDRPRTDRSAPGRRSGGEVRSCATPRRRARRIAASALPSTVTASPSRQPTRLVDEPHGRSALSGSRAACGKYPDAIIGPPNAQIATDGRHAVDRRRHCTGVGAAAGPPVSAQSGSTAPLSCRPVSNGRQVGRVPWSRVGRVVPDHDLHAGGTSPVGRPDGTKRRRHRSDRDTDHPPANVSPLLGRARCRWIVPCPQTSRTSASGIAASRSSSRTSNTALGVPAAHQTVWNRRSELSTTVCSGRSWPSGGMPPMA